MMKTIRSSLRAQHIRNGLKKSISVLLVASALTGVTSASAAPSELGQPVQTTRQVQKRPNILVIVADDLGYSDIGAFGGEITTPNLDGLALSGTRVLNFYVAPACSPTRAMLLTGRDNHSAGFGTMLEVASPDQRGAPGYEGFLSPGIPTIAERLNAVGYQTMMSGKWHLGPGPDQGPANRGFSQSFALIQGAHNHFGADQSEEFKARRLAPQYSLNGTAVAWPEGGYSSEVFSSQLIQFLASADRNKPFFAYLAFTAPHWPLQARPETIAKYRGRYDRGPDAIVRARMERMAATGLISPNMRTRALGQQQWWDSLTSEQRAHEARKMEVYAAMVEDMDTQIGRVLAELRSDGRLANTLVLFMSDNGPEGLTFDRIIDPKRPTEPLDFHVDNSTTNLGAPNSYFSYGPRWGQVSAAPYWGTKEHTSEGGIRAPLIVVGPNVAARGVVKTPLHVLDLTPTLLSAANVKIANIKYDGSSFLSALQGKPVRGRLNMDMELFYRAAARSGNLKAIYQPSRLPIFGEQTKPGEVPWQLYDLAADPGETTDLAATRPAKLRQLKKQWRKYARNVGVVLLPEDR